MWEECGEEEAQKGEEVRRIASITSAVARNSGETVPKDSIP